MLPPGHIATGYLVAKTVLHFGPKFTLQQTHILLALGAFFGFAPDLDMLYEFWQVKRLELYDDDPSHREYVSHAPVLWLIAGLAIYFLARDPFYKYMGLMVWLGSWSHFALDTIQHGVMWLWPYSKETYALKDRNLKSHLRERGFFAYWLEFLKFYATKVTLSFTIEICLIIAALVAYFR